MRSLIFCVLLAASSLACATELQAGQVWAYKTRPGESASTLTILKVEHYEKLGPVVHIRVEAVHVRHPTKGIIVSDAPHMPFKEAAVRSSITQLVSQSASIPEFQAGYDTWKKAHLAGQAGAFDITVSAALDAMLNAKMELRR